MSSSIAALIPEFQPVARDLVDLAARSGLLPQVTSTLRSHSHQAELYRRYLAGGMPYTVLPPGRSAHEYGYAMDMVVSPMDYLEDLGEVWRQAGGIWGGPADPVHFEYPGSPSRTGAQTTPLDQGRRRQGTAVEALIDFLSGFVPYLGTAQLAQAVYRMTAGGDETTAEYYLQHPAEGVTDALIALGI